MNLAEQPAHWPAMARAWEKTGSPLRPCNEDIAAFTHAAAPWMDPQSAPRVLLLGVTPELYRLPWPAQRDFIAVDRTPAMIEHVWPGRCEEVLQAGWLDLPLQPSSRDLALCDGGLHLLEHPAGQKQLVDRLHEVLAPGGRCLFRLFTPPPRTESADAVLAELLAGRIANLNQLKIRLGTALQSTAVSGVAVRDVWRALRAAAPDWAKLAARIGWPLDHLALIDAYRDSDARYHFVTIAQATDLFCSGGRFVFREAIHPSYPLGECCPLLVFDKS